MIVEAIALVGTVFTLLAGIGVVRFHDVLERAHALTKASTLGLVLVVIAATFRVRVAIDVPNLVLIGLLQLLTLPLSANLLSRASYRSGEIESRIDAVDEYAERHPP